MNVECLRNQEENVYYYLALNFGFVSNLLFECPKLFFIISIMYIFVFCR